eukprot:Clim_evm17s241 gene=Clim_evmTU17s241
MTTLSENQHKSGSVANNEARARASHGAKVLADFVTKSCAARAKGDDSTYTQLVNQMKDPNFPLQRRIRLLSGMALCVNVLSKENEVLVLAALHLAESGDFYMSQEFLETYMGFVRSLLSSHAIFLDGALQVLVTRFKDWPSSAGTSEPSQSEEDEVPSTKLKKTKSDIAIVGSHCGPEAANIVMVFHKQLAELLRSVPQGLRHVMPIIYREFPHKRREVEIHRNFTRHLFFVVEHSPYLTKQIISLVMEKATAIDVEIRQLVADDEDEDDEEDDDDGEDEEEKADSIDQEAIPQDGPNVDATLQDDMQKDFVDKANDDDHNEENNSEDSDRAGDISDDEELAARVKEMSEKLDAIMLVMFAFVESLWDADSHEGMTDSGVQNSVVQRKRLQGLVAHHLGYKPAKRNPDQVRKVQEALVHAFESTVLATHKTRFVQFAVFNLVSVQHDALHELIELLISIGLGQGETGKHVHRSNLVKRNAVSFLGSLLSRSTAVNSDTLIETLRRMRNFAYNYVQEHDSAASPLNPDIHRHAVFYSLCQNMFYVFCFRHGDILGHPMGRNVCTTGLGFQGLISSNLNPLRASLESVVDEFARIASDKSIAYCYSIMDRNRRHIAASAMQNGANGEQSESIHIDQYFPFDPYYLRHSKKYVQAAGYREWTEVAPDRATEEHPNNQHVTLTPDGLLSIASGSQMGSKWSPSPLMGPSTDAEHILAQQLDKDGFTLDMGFGQSLQSDTSADFANHIRQVIKDRKRKRSSRFSLTDE